MFRFFLPDGTRKKYGQQYECKNLYILSNSDAYPGVSHQKYLRHKLISSNKVCDNRGFEGLSFKGITTMV